ncbi:MAG: hypothetical protein D6677_08365 [Calditrichaeota bacterium]|nr:MAG: hypothetical protein D6677_08365 [Calditrichota bacterium]
MKRILFWLLAGTLTLWAQQGNLNLLKMRYGETIFAPSARSLSMGGAGLAAGNPALAAGYNPALAARADSGLTLWLGSGYAALTEDRSFPYYDNFNGFVDYGSFYYQDNSVFHAAVQIAWQLPPLYSGLNMVLSTSVQPFIDYNYTYFEEVRSSGFGDNLLAYNEQTSNGYRYRNTLTLAASYGTVSAGVSVAVLNGDPDGSDRIEPKALSVEDIARDVQISRKTEVLPALATLGAAWRVNERLTVGASFRTPFTIDETLTYSSTDTTYRIRSAMRYPARVGVGLDYRFRNILQARLMVDFYYTFWSRFEDSADPSQAFNNTYNARIGVEHVFFDDFAFRAGYSFETDRENRELTRTRLTTGIGYRMNRLEWNAGFAWSALEFFQADLYDNALYGETSRSDNDRVQWNETLAKIDLTIHL